MERSLGVAGLGDARIDVGSPLIELGRGARVAGLVSIGRFFPWDDTVIKVGPPLVTSLLGGLRLYRPAYRRALRLIKVGPPVVAWLPSARRAYGLIFPLDHSVLEASRGGPIVVCCDLEIDAGHVGVMGVAEGLRITTTEETISGPGRATACVTLDAPAGTSAILVRNAGEGPSGPCVTVRAVEGYRGVGPPRLRRRPHDLGFDLFVVLASPKTATQTIELTLRGLDPTIQVRRVHSMSEAAFAQLAHWLGPEDERAESVRQQISQARSLAREIDAVRMLGGRIAFITAIREPIDRAIASFFQSLPDVTPAFRELHAGGPAFVDRLVADMVASWQGMLSGTADESSRWLWPTPDQPSRFLAEEFQRVTGVDLLAHPIDRAAGFTLIQADRQAVLFFRYEDIARGLVSGLSALTGRRHIAVRDANRGDDKPYAALYREFRAKVRLPADLVTAIYERDPHLRHLYSEEEIAAFRTRWSAPHETRHRSEADASTAWRAGTGASA